MYSYSCEFLHHEPEDGHIGSKHVAGIQYMIHI